MCSASSGTPRAGRRALATITIVVALGGATATPALAQPVPVRPVVIDGPSSAIAGPTGLGMSVARDGSGGLVYLKQVGGVEHLFASALIGGTWQGTQQLDGGLPGPSSQPVIGASDGGLVVVAFVNGGRLYEVTRVSSGAPWGAATVLASGASSPSIQMTYLGKTYVAFTVADGGGHDVRLAYYNHAGWALEGPPLNNIRADDAGTGGGRPAVAAAGDGVANVAWGEGGHVFTRRVWGTSPSVVLEQADGPLPGCTEVSADQPSIGSGGDSSYAAVAFHEMLSCGGLPESRVLTNRLHASLYDGLWQSDGLAVPASDGADQPRVAVGEYGHGWVTSSRDSSHDVYGMFLGGNAGAGGVLRINGEPNAGAPDAVPAIAGLFSDLVTWQHDPGGGGAPDIRIRYAASGDSSLGPEMTLSSPTQGPANADAGLAADGDIAGDAAVAWVQGTGSSAEIVAGQLYQPPSGFSALRSFRYVRRSRPVLAWSAPADSWGPITYTVRIGGVPVARTRATSLSAPALANGSHTWVVTATNPAGLTNTMGPARVFVDTVAPRASFRLTGTHLAGSPVKIAVKATDAPPGVPRSHASGIARITVYWGDGTARNQIRGSKSHVYRRAGRFKVRVVIVDRAGNTTTVSRYVKIAAGKGK